MKELCVYIEILGHMQLVGTIVGDHPETAKFTYDPLYLVRPGVRPISISLPLQAEAFSPLVTKHFFEGLLPEGFSRRAVANWAKVPEEDYLSILEHLGRECLGALLIIRKGQTFEEGRYQKLTQSQVRELAAEGATKSTQILMETHLSLTGASGKAGLYYDEEQDEWYLPTGVHPSTHIVKQSHVRLNHIVMNEQYCMKVAGKLGMEVPESFIVNLGDGKDEDILLATRRYDRILSENLDENGLRIPYRLHQEDFCQALGIAATEKYEHENQHYMARMFDLVANVSSNPIEDQLKLWDSIVFNQLLGNTDCHLKNYSLVYGTDMKMIRLAPVYDIVCTAYYPSSTKMAFYIGGEVDISRITRQSFALESREIGLSERLAMGHYDRLAAALPHALQEAAEEMAGEGYEGVKAIRDTILNRLS